MSVGLSFGNCDVPLVLVSWARGAEGAAVELDVRRESPVVAKAGPFGIELGRALSLVNGVEEGVDGLGDEGVPVGLGATDFATAHNASRFFRLAAYLITSFSTLLTCRPRRLTLCLEF